MCRFGVLLAASFALGSVSLIGQDTTGVGAINGAVVDAEGTPAPFVTVCLVGTTRCEVTSADGRFGFDGLRATDYQLEIAAPGRAPFVSERLSVRAGLEQAVDVSLPPEGRLEEEVTVTAAAGAVAPEVKTSSYVISARQIEKDAGALQDVSRYVQSLPGVVIGSNDFRNDIIVRGGSPLENLFVVDNVEVPNINTFANFASAGGTVSILDSALISDVTFLTGGYPAPYINRASSVLQITQREGSRERPSGKATVGFAGAGGVAEGPLAGGRGSWVVSARRSFLDLFTNDVGFGGVPVLYTFNGKAVYDLGPRDRLWVINLTGVDRIRLGLTDDQIPDEEVFNFDIRYQGWRSSTGVNWQRAFGSRAVGLLGLTHSDATVRSTVKDLVRFGVPSDGVPAEDVIAASPIVFLEDSRERETTIKYDATVATGMGKVQVGGSLKVFKIGYQAAAPFGSDSPYSTIQGNDAFDLTTDVTTTQTGAYVQATTDLGRRINVTAGGRVDDYALLDATRFSPRLGVNVRISERLTGKASTGLYYQQPPYLFLTAFPANRTLIPLRAEHYVAGLTFVPAPAARVSVEVYRKDYSDYPVAREYPALSFASLGDTFNVREVLFPMVSAGVGRTEGVEVFAERKSAGRWYGHVSLTMSRARHAGLDGVLRPGSFDYPVTLGASGGWSLGSRWEVGSRVSYLSGRPYTPFDMALSTAQRRGIYDLSRVNAERAPAYFRLDLRVDRTFGAPTSPVVVFAGVQNITNRTNYAQSRWNRRLNAPELSEQIGAFPLLGLEWNF